MGHLYQLKCHGRIHETVGRCPEGYVQSTRWMDRKFATGLARETGLLMTGPFLQFWSFKIEDSASANGLQKQWYGKHDCSFCSSHSSSSLGPTIKASNITAL
jgi:hypothetical protein